MYKTNYMIVAKSNPEAEEGILCRLVCGTYKYDMQALLYGER